MLETKGYDSKNYEVFENFTIVEAGFFQIIAI